LFALVLSLVICRGPDGEAEKSPIRVTVRPAPPLPGGGNIDLEVTNVDIPDELIKGRTYTARATVTNKGPGQPEPVNFLVVFRLKQVSDDLHI